MNESQKSVRVDEIHAILRKRILTEQYIPGEKLSETALAKEFFCSRTPVRESIKRLQRDGLIVVQPKSGSYVKESNDKDHKELLEMRSYIEALCVRLIIEEDKDITPLIELYEKMDAYLQESPIDFVSYGETHYLYHHTLVSLAGNDLALRMFEQLNLRSSMLFYHSMNTKMSSITQNEHAKIIHLLKTKSNKCEQFIISHLWKNRKKYIPR